MMMLMMIMTMMTTMMMIDPTIEDSYRKVYVTLEGVCFSLYYKYEFLFLAL